MATKLLRIGTVEDRIGCKKSKIYELIAKGGFPKPVKIDHCSVWPECEVERWIADRVAEREVAA